MKVKTSEWLGPLLATITIVNLLGVVKISAGDRYVARLNRWYQLAEAGKWAEAGRLEKKLDPADTEWFKQRNKSEELKKRLNELVVKPNKTADDWMEEASIQIRLQKNDDAKVSVARAYEIDPIRQDIEKVYFSSL